MLVSVKIVNPQIRKRVPGRKSLEFTPGINLLVGPNGCGKSTVLKTIQDVSEGRVNTSAIDLEVSDPRFPLPILYHASEAAVQANNSNQGSNLLKLSAAKESHGQTQTKYLMSLADLVNPSVVLLDEPEIALDMAHLLEFKELIEEKIGEGMQFIIASHSPILWKCEDVNLIDMSKDGTYVRQCIKQLKKVMTGK